MKVLHFSAEPIGVPDLELSCELRGIADALLPGRVRNDTSLDVVPQARPSDVVCYLSNVKPDIVQFSSHATEGGLELCDAYFELCQYPPGALREALDGKGVKLLILNCCDTWNLAQWAIGKSIDTRKGSKRTLPKDEEISKESPLPGVVDVVIFTEGKLPEDQAHVFSETLYRGLQAKLSIGDAFKIAQNELDPAQRDIYRCEAREKDLEKIVLLDDSIQPALGTPSPQQSMLASARQLEEIRHGREADVPGNWWMLGATVGLALGASLVFLCVFDGKGCKPEDECWAALPDWVKMLSWFKLDPWLTFTFFVTPPLIYLVEYYWLKRPLEEAESAAFSLAISPPETEDESTLAERVKRLVEELTNKVEPLMGGQKND